MPSYRYKAMTASGAIATGVLEAASEPDAIAQIRRLGHLPIEARSGDRAGWQQFLSRDLWASTRVSAKAIANTTQALATLLQAGLPLERALKFVSELEQGAAMRRALGIVLDRVRGGASFADALERSGSFPKSYVTMVRAGELGGNLDGTLQRLTDYLSRASAIRETVMSALLYPALLLCTAGVSIVVILVFVLPQFAPLFAASGKALPPSTRFVMDAGAFLTNDWWILLLSLLLVVFLFQQAMKEARYVRMRDAALLRLPLLGTLLRKVQIERFSRTLSTLLTNGVPLPQALAITADTLTNSEMSDAVRDTASRLKEGEQLANRLRQSGAFPPVSLDLVRVGEESGSLDQMLLRQADLYEREISHSVDRLMTLLVPALTVVMGALVAGLISSVLLAIQSINDLAT